MQLLISPRRPSADAAKDVVLYTDAAMCKPKDIEDEPPYMTSVGGSAVVVTVSNKLYAVILTPLLGTVRNNQVLEARSVVRACRYVHDFVTTGAIICNDSRQIVDKFNDNAPTADTQLSFNAVNRYRDTCQFTLQWVPRTHHWLSFADCCANLAGTFDAERSYNTQNDLATLLDYYEQSWSQYKAKRGY